MPVETSVAVTEMYRMFQEAWDAGTRPLNGGQPYVAVYDNKESEPARQSKPWARVMARHNLGYQSSLGGPGGRRFTSEGVLAVQIFVPLGIGRSLLDNLGKIVVDAYEGKHSPSGVWFPRIRYNEAGSDQKWFLANVLVNFSYDRVK